MSQINVESLTGELKIGALALGNFDGVHLGHRSLLDEAVRLSKELRLESGALTFSPHPREYFSPTTYSRVYSMTQNIMLMEELGCQNVFVKSFDEACSLLSAESFMDLIFENLKFKILVVGFDFKFGKNREGDEGALSKWCFKNGVALKVVPCKGINGEKISSTKIKSLLSKGLVDVAALYLGKKYFHSGSTFKDQGLGVKMGFPTINLKLDHKIKIKRGVYLTDCFVSEQKYKAISNIGFRPSVSSKSDRLTLESHILDTNFRGTQSEGLVRVDFKKFVRAEQKFSNIESLKAQIEEDIRFARS